MYDSSSGQWRGRRTAGSTASLLLASFLFLTLLFLAPDARAATSASGTKIPSASQIVDAENNAWTVASGVVYENGKTAGYSANVILLLYYNGLLYHENSSYNWWSWNGTWVSSNDPRTVSASGTTIPSASQIVDAQKDVWTVASGLIYRNGVQDPVSSNVILLLTYNGLLYQENSSHNWYRFSSWGTYWTALGGDPRGPSASGTTIPSASQIVDAQNNVWTLASGLIYRNGVHDSVSSNVILLLTYNGLLYQENSSHNWYRFSSWGTYWTALGGDPRTSTRASASGTTIPSATQIIDAQNNVWTLASGLIYRNGVQDPVSSNVILLLTYNGLLYQENSSHNWYRFSSWGTYWTALGGDPRTSTTASASAKALLTYLQGLAGSQILSGQHSNYWDGNVMDEFTGSMPNVTIGSTGLTPAILGTTISQVGSQEDGVTLSNQWLASGGIVEVSVWPVNPYTGVDDNTRTGFTFSDIYTPGKALNTNWNNYLDTLAAKLKAINGPVMYRPFVELNGNWSWWAGQPTGEFIALWQYTYNYMVHTKGVTNALWIYNVNEDLGNYTAYYPGSSYVDIVSWDSYPPDAGDATWYNALATLGKPIILAEAGCTTNNTAYSGDYGTVLAAVKANFPKVVGIVVWSQSWALSEQYGASTFMNDPKIVNRNKLPSGL